MRHSTLTDFSSCSEDSLEWEEWEDAEEFTEDPEPEQYFFDCADTEAKLKAFEHVMKKKEPDYEALRPYFLMLPVKIPSSLQPNSPAKANHQT